MRHKLIIATFLFATSCGYNNTKLNGNGSGGSPGGDNGGQGAPGGSGGLDFATVRAQIFQPHCFGCHSAARGDRAGLNVETFQNVKSNLGSIQRRINAGTMPEAGPLSKNLMDLLNAWIAAGAPEVATNGGAANPGAPGTTPGNGTETPTDPGGDIGDDDCDHDFVNNEEERFVEIEEGIYFDTERETLRRGRGRGRGGDDCD